MNASPGSSRWNLKANNRKPNPSNVRMMPFWRDPMMRSVGDPLEAGVSRTPNDSASTNCLPPSVWQNSTTSRPDPNRSSSFVCRSALARISAPALRPFNVAETIIYNPVIKDTRTSVTATASGILTSQPYLNDVQPVLGVRFSREQLLRQRQLLSG